jgi:transcriptional regulator with XRE-family HTH domain
MTTIYDQRYIRLVEHLIKVREDAGVTQVKLARALGAEQSTVSKVETFHRRLDIIELFDWLKALGYSPKKFLYDIAWLDEEINKNFPAMPVPGKAESWVVGKLVRGTRIEMAWRGERKDVLIEGMPVEAYFLSINALREPRFLV